MNAETTRYDMFSQMNLIKESKLDLKIIREVMKNVHNYNWISKQISVKD